LNALRVHKYLERFGEANFNYNFLAAGNYGECSTGRSRAATLSRQWRGRGERKVVKGNGACNPLKVALGQTHTCLTAPDTKLQLARWLAACQQRQLQRQDLTFSLSPLSPFHCLSFINCR